MKLRSERARKSTQKRNEIKESDTRIDDWCENVFILFLFCQYFYVHMINIENANDSCSVSVSFSIPSFSYFFGLENRFQRMNNLCVCWKKKHQKKSSFHLFMKKDEKQKKEWHQDILHYTHLYSISFNLHFHFVSLKRDRILCRQL